MTPVAVEHAESRPGWATALSGWLPTPPDAPPSERRAYNSVRLIFPLGLAAHVIYLLVFAGWGVWPMALVNIGSVLVWALAMRQTQLGRLARSFWLVVGEAVVHALLVLVFVGWGFGQQYALLLVIVGSPLIIPSLRIEVLSSALMTGLFIGGYYYTELTEPQYDVPVAQLAVVGVLNTAVILASSAFSIGHSARAADRAEAALAIEHARSERLLTNVLPVPIAARLKDREEVIADGVDGASVLFADIVGFTTLSAQRTPEQVVTMLNGVFTRLDALVDVYGLEKIKTIGDAYMVAAGIPTPREDHAQVLAKFALAARGELAEHNLTTDVPVELRIGINSGPVVAGVIGRRRFLYDLWGDTVNTASRMESHGLPGQIQITDATRALLDGEFTCTERGVIDIKGKGPTRAWLLESEAVPAPVG